MATMTQMPAPPPDHGGLRPNRSEKNPTIAAEDDEDWVRELRMNLQQNMEERLREQEKEIEDEIQVHLDDAIKRGRFAAEDREDHLARMRAAKDSRLKRMQAMLWEESEAMIREERSLRQWSVDGGLSAGDSELTEAFKREQQALLDKFSKDGRRSASSSPVADRQRHQDPSPPPSSSIASTSPTNIRPSAPRISPTNSASSAQTQASQTNQQQQRKASQQHIWKPPVQQNEGGHPRTASMSSTVNQGFSTPQRAGSIVDNAARRNAGASSSHIVPLTYQTPQYSIPSSTAPSTSYSSPYWNIPTKAQQSPWITDPSTTYTEEPEDISGSEDDDYRGSQSEGEDDSSDEEPTTAPSWQGSWNGVPPKSSPRIIQGDRGRGRGRGQIQSARPSIPSQQRYDVKHSYGDLRGKFDVSQPRAAPLTASRNTDHQIANENLRENHKTSQPPIKLWSPEVNKPTQARPIPSTNTTRTDHSVYGDGTSFGSYGSLGSVSNLGHGLPPRRPSNANSTNSAMTPEEREKIGLYEADRTWAGHEKGRSLEPQTSPLPPAQPPIFSASRSTIPVPQSSSARQRTPEPLSSSPKPGSGSFHDKIWTPPSTKPPQERERNDPFSTSRSPPQSQQSSNRNRHDSDASASRISERQDPHKSGVPQPQPQPQPSTAFPTAPPSILPPQRPTEPVKFPLSPPLTTSYSSDSYESDFSSRSRPSAVPLSRQPTEEFTYQPNERDRFRPRNKDDSRKDDNPPVSTELHDKVNTDHAESSSLLEPSELERKAEELRRQEEELKRRQKELSEREEAVARREEEERRRRDNEEKLREREKKEEEERIRELRRIEEEKALERKREEERLRVQRKKEEDKARERLREEDRKREEDRRREEDRMREQRRKDEERARELQRKEEDKARELQRKEEEKARELQRKEEEKARELQRKEEEKARELQRKEEERVNELQRKEEERVKELQREEERNKIEQEKKDRAQAELMQREEEARARTEEKLWNEAKRNARQNSFAADRPMSTASFASSASNASFASRTSTTSSSSGSSYSSWSSGGRSAASSATSASTAPDPTRKTSTSSSSTAWGASAGPRSSASANTTPKASSTPRPTPTSTFPPKGSGSSSAYASAAGAPTSYEEWERKQQERMKAQQEQFQRDQMRAEQEKLRASSAASGMDTIMVAWSSYEREWNGLKEKQDGSLTWRTFPWPLMRKPSEPEDLTANGIGALVLSVHHSNEKSNRDRLKEQLLRWHPDRFENRWLKKVSDKEQEKVRNGAGQVVRALNELMTRESNLASGGGLF